MSVTIAKWTLDDYHRMIDAGILANRRVELLNGELNSIENSGFDCAQPAAREIESVERSRNASYSS